MHFAEFLEVVCKIVIFSHLNLPIVQPSGGGYPFSQKKQDQLQVKSYPHVYGERREWGGGLQCLIQARKILFSGKFALKFQAKVFQHPQSEVPNVSGPTKNFQNGALLVIFQCPQYTVERKWFKTGITMHCDCKLVSAQMTVLVVCPRGFCTHSWSSRIGLWFYHGSTKYYCGTCCLFNWCSSLKFGIGTFQNRDNNTLLVFTCEYPCGSAGSKTQGLEVTFRMDRQ